MRRTSVLEELLVLRLLVPHMAVTANGRNEWHRAAVFRAVQSLQNVALLLEANPDDPPYILEAYEGTVWVGGVDCDIVPSPASSESRRLQVWLANEEVLWPLLGVVNFSSYKTNAKTFRLFSVAKLQYLRGIVL